jgi:hypothetical protein
MAACPSREHVRAASGVERPHDICAARRTQSANAVHSLADMAAARFPGWRSSQERRCLGVRCVGRFWRIMCKSLRIEASPAVARRPCGAAPTGGLTPANPRGPFAPSRDGVIRAAPKTVACAQSPSTIFGPDARRRGGEADAGPICGHGAPTRSRASCRPGAQP